MAFSFGGGQQAAAGQAAQQAPRSGSVFKQIADSDPSQGGVYLMPGVYLLWVDALKIIMSRKREDLFIAQVDILESSNPQRPAGTSASYVANLTKHDAAPGNAKSCIAAVGNEPVEKVTEEVCTRAVDDKTNPCHGRLVRCEVVETLTRDKKPFSKHLWSGVPDDVQAKAKDMHKAAGFAAF